MRRPLAAGWVSLLLLAGCNSGGEVVETAPPTIAFEGKVEPRLVGDWKLQSGGKSTMYLHEDGASRIESEIEMLGKKEKSEVAGRWLVQGERLLIQRKGPDGKEMTVDYDYKLDPSGQKLDLSIPGRKSKQSYAKDKD